MSSNSEEQKTLNSNSNDIMDFIVRSLKEFTIRGKFKDYIIEVTDFDGTYNYGSLLNNDNKIPIVLQIVMTYVNGTQEKIQPDDYKYVFEPYCKKHGKSEICSSIVKYTIKTKENQEYIIVPMFPDHGFSLRTNSYDSNISSKEKKRSFSSISEESESVSSTLYNNNIPIFSFIPKEKAVRNILLHKQKIITFTNCTYDILVSITIVSKTYCVLAKESEMKRSLISTDEKLSQTIRHVQCKSTILTFTKQPLFTIELSHDQSANKEQFEKSEYMNCFTACIYLGKQIVTDIVSNVIDRNADFKKQLSSSLNFIVAKGGIETSSYNLIGDNTVLISMLNGPNVTSIRKNETNENLENQKRRWKLLEKGRDLFLIRNENDFTNTTTSNTEINNTVKTVETVETVETTINQRSEIVESNYINQLIMGKTLKSELQHEKLIPFQISSSIPFSYHNLRNMKNRLQCCEMKSHCECDYYGVLDIHPDKQCYWLVLSELSNDTNRLFSDHSSFVLLELPIDKQCNTNLGYLLYNKFKDSILKINLINVNNNECGICIVDYFTKTMLDQTELERKKNVVEYFKNLPDVTNTEFKIHQAVVFYKNYRIFGPCIFTTFADIENILKSPNYVLYNHCGFIRFSFHDTNRNLCFPLKKISLYSQYQHVDYILNKYEQIITLGFKYSNDDRNKMQYLPYKVDFYLSIEKNKESVFMTVDFKTKECFYNNWFTATDATRILQDLSIAKKQVTTSKVLTWQNPLNINHDKIECVGLFRVNEQNQFVYIGRKPIVQDTTQLTSISDVYNTTTTNVDYTTFVNAVIMN